MNDYNSTAVSADERLWGLFAHLSTFIGLVIPLGGDAGRAVTCVIEDLRASGCDVSGVRVATLAETGELAYVFRLP